MLAFQDPTSGAWQQLRDAFDRTGYDSALTLAVYLVAGGLLAFYVRLLYRRTSRNPSADSVARVFPLLTLVTIAVISVVKASLSLSLGLVGALSIVRFRAAIKDPEELVYLFLCIGIGLSLGAAQPWIAISLVAAATLFVLVFERFGRGHQAAEAFVTVVGPAGRFVGDGPDTALAVVDDVCSAVVVQRCDLDGDEGQLRAQVRAARGLQTQRLISALRERLPDCQVSYVDAGALS
jgi:hypothetical protein